MKRRFIETTSTGESDERAESRTITWDCGCWEVHELDGYTHEATVTDHGECDRYPPALPPDPEFE